MNHSKAKNPLNISLHQSIEDMHKVIIIRHAESEFNKEISKIYDEEHKYSKETLEEMKRKVRNEERLIDCGVSEIGYIECKRAALGLSKYQFKKVFVSPMRRCLITIKEILSEMKLENCPEIIVHPLLFEKVEDSCDLLKDVRRNMEEFKEFNWDLFTEVDIPYYQMKYCDIYPNSLAEVRNYYEHAKEKFVGGEEQAHIQLALSAFEQLEQHQDCLESSKSAFNRLAEFNKFLSGFLSKISDKEKILICAHSILLQHMTCENVQENTLTPLANEKILYNCEYLSINIK